MTNLKGRDLFKAVLVVLPNQGADVGLGMEDPQFFGVPADEFVKIHVNHFLRMSFSGVATSRSLRCLRL